MVYRRAVAARVGARCEAKRACDAASDAVLLEEARAADRRPQLRPRDAPFECAPISRWLGYRAKPYLLARRCPRDYARHPTPA